MRRDLLDDGGDVVTVGDVERPRFCRAAACRDLAGHGLRGLGADVGDGDIGAVGRKH